MAVKVIGVPTAAGAYGNGVARAPAAFRKAGLVEALTAGGVHVSDTGDLPFERFAPDPQNPTQQNLARVIGVAREVAARVAAIDATGDVPLVLGGDCSITLGVISGLCAQRPELALAYFDGDADMSTPATTTSGIVDAMGIATMLAVEGAAADFVSLGDRVPLMDGRRVAIIGYDDSELLPEPRKLLLERGVHLLPGVKVRGRARSAAGEALEALAGRDGLIVHFDVDVIDSTDVPLGQFPHFNQGLSLADAVEVLTVLIAAPDVAAIVVTEANPDNDPDDIYVRQLVGGISDALVASVGDH